MKAALAALLIALAVGAQAAPVSDLHHDLRIALDPSKRTLRATDRITLKGEVTLQLAARFKVEYPAARLSPHARGNPAARG